MHPFIQFKRVTPTILALALACVGLSQSVQAVSPTPDGCYPNFTTAEGCDALNALTTGAGNTAIGWRSLFFNTDGSFNTGVGGGALALNNADSNTAVGAAALLLNTSGNQNTATGTDALGSNTTGNNNTANGVFTLFSNTTGISNTAVGLVALSSNTNGSNNTAIGSQALGSNTTGTFNTAIGATALSNNTTGSFNIVLGPAGTGIMTASNVICIGNNGMDASNTTWIGNIFEVTTLNTTTTPVIVSADGQLGTVASSERFKKDIATMDKASDAILSLRPITFHYKSDTKNTPQFGLIAEEVAKVNPALVLPDKEGKPYTVRYDAVNAMLLNEFLKEHHTVRELKSNAAKQEATIARQQKQIEALTAGLQKVSEQLEASKPAPQVVNNNQ